MKRVAIILATVTTVIGGLASSAYAYGPGYPYGYWGGYALDHYRDYIPVGTYDGYVPASYGEYTTSTYNDAPVYLGYRFRTVIHPANYRGSRVIHGRRHWK